LNPVPEPQPVSRTLVIDRPFGMVFLRSAVIIIIAWFVAEMLVRAMVAAGMIPPPGIGSVNAELDTKLLLLDKYMRENGPVDCFFLGSSQFDEAVDPAVFDEVFLTESGRQLRCFNFSLGTMTASPAGRMARLLVERYHPRLLFIGISARDFSDDFGELTRPLLDDPWVRYSLGEFSVGGWLTEHSYAYRLMLTLRAYLNPDYIVFHDRLSYQLTETGYLQLEGSDLSNPKKNFIPNFSMTREDLAGLDEAASLNSDSLQVVYVEVPVHHSFIPYYIHADPDAYELLFAGPISANFAEQNLPFWRTQNIMQELVPDEGWTDVKHFNRIGAEIFSTWLARQTAQALKQQAVHLAGD
jgi:hypothetical protein